MEALLVHQRLKIALKKYLSGNILLDDEDLKDNMRKTNSTINLSLGDEVLSEVSGKKSPSGIWQS